MQRYIFSTECALARTPRIVPCGLGMVGPVICNFGNDAQKQRFLPDILASRIWWCQGYSEPNAGSDLASQTHAQLRECREHYQRIVEFIGEVSRGIRSKFVQVPVDRLSEIGQCLSGQLSPHARIWQH